LKHGAAKAPYQSKRSKPNLYPFCVPFSIAHQTKKWCDLITPAFLNWFQVKMDAPWALRFGNQSNDALPAKTNIYQSQISDHGSYHFIFTTSAGSKKRILSWLDQVVSAIATWHTACLLTRIQTNCTASIDHGI